MKKIKLFIQIPCLNEEKTLPLVIGDLPVKINGVDEIYTLIIDDGSTDNTIEVAKAIGVDYIVRNHRNLGLAKSFNRGLEASLYLGADIIVNTDGDNQYQASDIEKLIEPILKRKADMVVGCRDILKHNEFSLLKKILQKIGSKVVRLLSDTKIPDTTSGFRAIDRKSAIMFSFISSFSYTIEMLIQASRLGLIIGWVPVKTNSKLRESRLFKSIPSFIYNQIKIMLSMTLFYRPMYFFGSLAFIFLLISGILSLRIIYNLWMIDPTMAKFKVGTSALLLFSSLGTIIFFIAGLLGSYFAGIRFLSIDIRNRIRNTELQQKLFPLDIDIIVANKFFKWQRIKNI